MKWLSGFLAAVAVAAVACSDSFKPTIENVAGTYHLQSLTTTDVTDTTDWVRAGATVSLTVDPNGTTTGSLFFPAPAVGDSDVTLDLTGTWQLSRDIVEFDQTADTFLRDMTFTATDNRLMGDQTFGGTRVRATLSK